MTSSKKSLLPPKPCRRVAYRAGFGFVAYVLIYVLNSSLGGYWLDMEADGRIYAKEFAVSSDTMWQPRVGYFAWNEGDFVGWFFRPLIVFDQKYCHPTKDSLNDQAYDKWLCSQQAVSEIHPKLSARFVANRFINRFVQPPSP